MVRSCDSASSSDVDRHSPRRSCATSTCTRQRPRLLRRLLLLVPHAVVPETQAQTCTATIIATRAAIASAAMTGHLSNDDVTTRRATWGVLTTKSPRCPSDGLATCTAQKCRANVTITASRSLQSLDNRRARRRADACRTSSPGLRVLVTAKMNRFRRLTVRAHRGLRRRPSRSRPTGRPGAAVWRRPAASLCVRTGTGCLPSTDSDIARGWKIAWPLKSICRMSRRIA